MHGTPPWQLMRPSRGQKSFECKIDAATANFFPKEAPLDNSERQWFSSALKAMGEKSFRVVSKRDTEYRFLWLRSFHHPISVSIKILNHGNGGAILHAVELDGADLYGVPYGKKLRSFTHRYYPKLAKELIAKVESSQFWTIPVVEPHIKAHSPQTPPINIPLGTSGPIGSGFKDAPIVYNAGSDGAQWILEASQNGKYRMVKRWSPKDGTFRELCVIFLLLAGLYPKENQAIY